VHHTEPFLEEERVGTPPCNVEVITNPMRDTVMDAYALMISLLLQAVTHHEELEPITGAKRFLELIKAVVRPSYEGREMSLLKVIA